MREAMKTEIVGDGPPIVLVPGGLTGWLSWKPHVARLARDHRVIRVQLLNVDLGLRNERLPEGYCVGMEQRALGEAINREGVLEADLAAWSFGAEVALSYAIDNPDRVRSLTLIEPPAIWVQRSRGPLSPELLEQQRLLAAMWRTEISEEQLAWFCHFAGFVPPNLDPRDLAGWPAWFAHRQSLAHGDATYQHSDDIAKVRAFAKPVLLFKSRDSPAFLKQIVHILGEEFPRALVHDIPGGHALHIVRMGEFLGYFLPFLQGEEEPGGEGPG